MLLEVISTAVETKKLRLASGIWSLQCGQHSPQPWLAVPITTREMGASGQIAFFIKGTKIQKGTLTSHCSFHNVLYTKQPVNNQKVLQCY